MKTHLQVPSGCEFGGHWPPQYTSSVPPLPPEPLLFPNPQSLIVPLLALEPWGLTLVLCLPFAALSCASDPSIPCPQLSVDEEWAPKVFGKERARAVTSLGTLPPQPPFVLGSSPPMEVDIQGQVACWGYWKI